MDTYLIDRYKGKYRVYASLDMTSGDFPRDERGNIDESYADFYLETLDGDRITHSCGDLLGMIVFSSKRGRKLIERFYGKTLGAKASGPERKAEELVEAGLFGDCEFLDGEVCFSFRAKDLPVIARIVTIKTKGKGISPCSAKCLPASDYRIPEKDMARYKEAIAGMKGLDVARYGKEFGKSLVKDFPGVLDRNRMKANQYFHKSGNWNKWIKFLEESRLSQKR